MIWTKPLLRSVVLPVRCAAVLAIACEDTTTATEHDAGARTEPRRDASIASAAGGANPGSGGMRGGTSAMGGSSAAPLAGGSPGSGGAHDGSAAGGGSGSSAADAGPSCASGTTCDGGGCFAPQDPKSCGACGNDCSELPHVDAASVACDGKRCEYHCSDGFADCDGAGTGCTTDLSVATSCGSCTTKCAGASPLCAPKSGGGFECVAACPATASTNCGASCVDTATSVANCVGCSNRCTTNVTHATPACKSGCTFVCDPGWTRCNNACVDFANDDANCGGCGAAFACSPPMRCRTGACVCPAMCGGQCSDPDNDAKNCGRCGHDCLGGKCVLGACQPVALATNQKLPWCMALDATHVYWTNYMGGNVMKAALDGSEVTELASGQQEPYGIAVDKTSVYWVDATSDGAVRKVPLAGGAPQTIVQGSRNLFRAIAVDSTRLYVADDGNPGGILTTPLSGGTPVKLAGGSPSEGCNMGLDAREIYWVAYPGQDAIDSVLLSGGPLRTVYAHPSSLGDAWGITIDARNAYWTETNKGAVYQVSRMGGTPITISTGGFTRGIAVDTTRIYWADQAAAAVRSAPIGGGKVTDVATGQAGVLEVTVDDAAVYFITGTGSVMKVAK